MVPFLEKKNPFYYGGCHYLTKTNGSNGIMIQTEWANYHVYFLIIIVVTLATSRGFIGRLKTIQVCQSASWLFN